MSKLEKSPSLHMRRANPLTGMALIMIGLILLAFMLGFSVSVGAADIKLMTVWDAIFSFDPTSTQHSIIQELRLPRSLADIMVGAAFAVAGALMQGMTRNPLADSELLGINAGAILMVAICFAFLPGLSYNMLILFAFLGAGIGAGLVYGTGSMARNGLTPVRLALAGAAVSALLTALGQAIAIHFRLSQDIAFWYAGGVAGIKWSQLSIMFPWIVVALIGAFLLAPSLTILTFGDDVASSLGQRTRLVKMAGALCVLVLAGVAVSAVGPIGFVGLVIPHITRFFVGFDYRWVIPCSAVFGGVFVLLADIGARIIHPPYETPIGVLFALIGVPFFLYVARKGGRELQ